MLEREQLVKQVFPQLDLPVEGHGWLAWNALPTAGSR
jgi:hypothetical protein